MCVTYCDMVWQVPIPRYDKAAQSGKGDRAPQASCRWFDWKSAELTVNCFCAKRIASQCDSTPAGAASPCFRAFVPLVA